MAIKAPATTPKQATKRVAQVELEVSNYPCRVAQVIDMGRQYKSIWDDVNKRFTKDPSKIVNMLMLTYEFTTEFMKDEQGNELEDKPRWMSEDFPVYALDSELATSNKRMKAFDPTFKKFEGDFTKLAGEACTVTIAARDNGKAKIGNVTPPMKGMVVPPLKNPVKVLDLDAPDIEVFQSLPTWLQDKIKENLDFEGSALEAILGGSTGQASKPTAPPVETKQEVAEEPQVAQEEYDEDVPW